MRHTDLNVKHSDEVGPLRVVLDQTGHAAASLVPAAVPVRREHLDHCRGQRLRRHGEGGGSREDACEGVLKKGFWRDIRTFAACLRSRFIVCWLQSGDASVRAKPPDDVTPPPPTLGAPVAQKRGRVGDHKTRRASHRFYRAPLAFPPAASCTSAAISAHESKRGGGGGVGVGGFLW